MPYTVTTDYTGRQIDLQAFRGSQRPLGQFRIELSLTKDGRSQQVAGIQKLAQRYVNILLTRAGDIHFDQGNGSSFFVDIRIGGVYMAEQLLHSFVFANAGTIAQLQTEDANPDYGAAQPDEMIADARLLASLFDNATGRLNLRIWLRSRTGDSVTFIVPVGA
jgi:hypothetical protein